MGIYAGCSSPLLKNMVEGLFDQAERYRRFSARFRTGERSKGTEHQRIVDAVLQRNVDAACSLIQGHIRSTELNVTESLRAMQAASAG
ncbi:FCD domain-containing protein [Ideonella azotifigens]|uniref:GntR C-terminal domain-containing protein n=1 Tax=Ideonella azotifigens TaxID=513160 RepID=A0ABN1KBP2_9BURK|nr:FCD domain-containing protein [Ideonella azotifigens]